MREKKKRPIGGGYPSKLCTMGVLNRWCQGISLRRRSWSIRKEQLIMTMPCTPNQAHLQQPA